MPAAVPAGFRALPLPIAQLSLAAVLKCGQSFRWFSVPLHATEIATATTFHTEFEAATPTHEYRFCLKDRVVCLRQSYDNLFYRAVFPRGEEHASTKPEPEGSSAQARRDAETLAFLRDYFQLDVDLTKLYDEWSDRDSVFRGLRYRFSGIRMLRQDPWENIVSCVTFSLQSVFYLWTPRFICSANNNISRITKMVQNLCTHFSPALVTLPAPSVSGTALHSEEEQSYHPFPPPSVLAHPSVAATLRKLGFGYRAEYIQRTAQMMMEAHGSDEEAERWMCGLREMSTEDARVELLKLMGVGRKVADCILLMSLDKVRQDFRMATTGI